MFEPKLNPINDDYIINDNDVLGHGISGAVKTCVHKLTNVKHALKILPDKDESRREIEIHCRAYKGCKYIVQVADVYKNKITENSKEMQYYLVTEFVEGGELFAEIIKRSEENHSFTEQEVAHLMYQICSAVKHLHDMGIAHRDLKPENLLLLTNGPTTIKLIDFGFAKLSNDGLETPCFTPYYAPPEILNNRKSLERKAYDISCDIWSLGVIMYILLSGRAPFSSSRAALTPGMENRIKTGDFTFPFDQWKMISAEAKELICAMIEPSTEDRYTINEVMKSQWISKYTNVPSTPLSSIDLLREGRSEWNEIENAINASLVEIREGFNGCQLNLVTENDDPILKRRQNQTNNQN